MEMKRGLQISHGGFFKPTLVNVIKNRFLIIDNIIHIKSACLVIRLICLQLKEFFNIHVYETISVHTELKQKQFKSVH